MPAAPEILRDLTAAFEWRMFRIMIATLEDNDGTRYTRLVEDHGAGAVVLPYDAERRVALLIKQYRAPVAVAGAESAILLEPPGGLLEGDEPSACVRKEAMEEAGVRLDDVEAVATVWTLSSVSTERLSLFLAPYASAQRAGAGGGLAEENENIDVVEVPLDELALLTRSGEVIDLRLLVLIQALQLRQPQLFST